MTTTAMSLDLLLGPQLRAFRQAGYEVHAASAADEFVEAVVESGVIYHPLQHATRSVALGRDVAACYELYRLFRRLKPDIVHTHNPKPGVYGRVAAFAARVPLVVNTQHGLYAQRTDRAARRLPVFLLERLAAACSDVELVQNVEDLETLRRWRVPSRKLRLLGNGIDLDRFSPRPRSVREVVRAELALGDRDVVVGAVGRLVREKGYPELFDAARRVREARPEAVFLVAGPIEDAKSDGLSAEELAAAEAAGVRFLGHRSDTERLYAAFDVYVLASHREGFPRSAMEAAASGLPIVATNIRGCRQVVEQGVTGHLVPVNDAAALAAAIIDLVDDAEVRAEFGRAARKKADAEFDQATVIDRTLDVYSLASRRATSRRLGARAAKRAIDVVGACVALALGAPLIVIVAAVVRLRLGSPVLFRQERAGRGGTPFSIVKFRTMSDARDDAGRLLPDGERLGRVGRYLRATSLDELPEMWNVLRGEMSLVGPRPLPTAYLPRYTAAEGRRHEVRPGVTGWAQVNGRNSVDWDDRLALDVWYVDNWSLRLDLRILAMTAEAVLRRHGISAEGAATMGELRPEPAET